MFSLIGWGCRAAVARAPDLPLGVELVGDRERVRVELDDGVQRGTAAVDLLDPPQVHLGELPRRIAAAAHPVLELRGRRLFEWERGARLQRLAERGEDEQQRNALDHGVR
jgi:hypothetical protein